MGTIRETLDEAMIAWLGRQRLFFVATAPVDGHVNVSPKGLDTFRVLGPTQVAYMDLTGSGVETIAHVRENGRITLMFCAFEGPPRIVRLYGTGSVHQAGDELFEAVAATVEPYPGRRSVVAVELDRVADSCGFGVPLYAYVGERDRLLDWSAAKSSDELIAYWGAKNGRSIDGLPGLQIAQDAW